MIMKKALCAGVALCAAALAAGAANAQSTSIAWKGAPQFQNDSVTFKVRGRTYMDWVGQDVDRATGVDFKASNTRIRTARLGVEGTWNDNWAYKAEVQFARGTAEWEDLILEFRPNDATSIMVGNFKTVSIENLTSSRYTTFMERGPYNDMLGIGRVATVQVKFNGPNWTVAGAVTGDSLNSADVATNSATGSQEGVGYLARATFAPIDTDETKVHIGAWARHRNRGDQSRFTYAVRNNTHYGAQYVTSGAVGESDNQYALEGALIHKNFSVQAEWANIDVKRAAGVSSDLKAYYVYASWFPTGEMRRYEGAKGEFNRVKVLNPMTAGGLGAVELGLRYDKADLTDVAGAGEYTAWTAGATWYPHPYVRFMANYTMAENDNPAVGADVDVDTLQFRAQFDF